MILAMYSRVFFESMAYLSYFGLADPEAWPQDVVASYNRCPIGSQSFLRRPPGISSYFTFPSLFYIISSASQVVSR